MNDAALREIVEAVLYEGFILYPYRASSKKNQSRFTFGRVYPETFSVAEKGAEPCVMQTQCLLVPDGPDWSVEITFRFLQPMARELGRIKAAPADAAQDPLDAYEAVRHLDIDGKHYEAWQEAVERTVTVKLTGPDPSSVSMAFGYSSLRTIEPIVGGDGQQAGVITRNQAPISGAVEASAEPFDGGALRLTARITNLTPSTDAESVPLQTFASTNAVLRAISGRFISLTDPPPELAAAAGRCRNVGVWPVLVGDESRSERDTVLASPIILPDYPRIAPESAGSLFDGTEIDEILSLRILTMTEDEKREMRGIDDQARSILERTEKLGPEDFERMHGVMREPHGLDGDFFNSNSRLEYVEVAGVPLRAGDRVRIRPRARADAMDLVLAGKTAQIEAIEQDAENKVHVALVIEDDPGLDCGLLRQPGHRFFYGVDEIVPLGREDVA